MEALDEAPFCEIKSVTELKHDGLMYDVKVDCWRNRVRDGREPYRTLPGDFVLLSDSEPCDMKCAGWTCNFASVKKISEGEIGDNCTVSSIQLKTAHSVEVEGQKSKSLYMVYLRNMTAQKRIWSALRMRKNLKIIEKVLSKNDLGEEDFEICPLKSHIKVEENLESILLSELNESQVKAILASVSKIECKHKLSVQLIWGPPGTGKTTTLSILLCILLRMNVRTVVCAPSNTAITGLASRVVEVVRNSVQTEAERSFLSCPLGEMLIFGNKDNLKVGSDVQEIFVNYRVERLVHCSAPATGWKHCIALMVEFLEDCVSQHRMYKANELMRSRQFLRNEVQKSKSKSLLEFARDQFTLLASPLKTCMITFSTHLPRNFINDQNYQGIVKLISLLDSIELLLFEDSSMTSSELEAIFLQKVVIGSESFVGRSSLTYIRSECLSVLRSLKISLDNLGLKKLTDRTSTMEFCFQKASMIFCTTSSSYKLHSLNTEPFHLLVIDEAAQLKECETTIALQISEVRHAILVGDEMQLPATVSSKLSEKAGFRRSLFERLSSMGHLKHMLNVQYRMHPSISRFPNSKFYFNQILDAPNVQSESYERCYLEGRMFGSYSFINIRGGREELDDDGHSMRNLVEVAVVWKLVGKLFKAWNGSKEKLSIGLISPYTAQVSAIRDRILPKYDSYEGFKVKVMSIDGFQGGEEDVIIISTVRSHKGGSIGFLSSPQRTNVALTRARHCLWILGNERTLSKSDSAWAALVADAKDCQCFFNADEICDVWKTIIDVNKELDQLDDLVSWESLHFENSRWEVLFSENFKSSFLKLKSSGVKKLALGLVLKVASGWRPRKINVDRTCKNSLYVVKQFKVCNYYVVCSVDIIKDSIYKQVLRVWDILPRAETSKLLKRLESIFCMFTDDFVNHCKEKLFEGHLEIPKTWSLCDDIIQFKNRSKTGANNWSEVSASNLENSKVSESLQLMKFYSLSTGAANYLLSDHKGREVDLPFEVTEEEREIILFPRSSFILGRSGTGKTTILTMKLFQKHQLHCIASRDSTAADNNVHISNKVDAGHYLDESKGITLHQLFVTESKTLLCCQKPYISADKVRPFTLSLHFARGNFSESMNVTGVNDIDEMADFNDIPDTFVGFPQEKYPLIITFQKFLMMLDGTLGNSFFQRFYDERDFCHYESTKSVALQTLIRKNEVTYDRFCSLYWHHMNAKLTKNLDASRVFTEIMSHIKGGLQHGEACDSKLSREVYISLSYRKASTLSSEKRNTIYDIFEDYEKLKLKRGEFDLADLVMDIHHRLKRGHLLGDKMDFVYIDEVQDLTMRQILLFRCICNNVDEGFVFSGDTAQTIARGIDFRLAQSVIDLICRYFPQSIDSLDPETSRVYGESPVVFKPGCNENSIMSIFGQSAKSGRKWVGFGADQVILVRDDSARNEIFSYVGSQALVLTVMECKGLEFQDVLLYNFFGSSPMSNQWRVVNEFSNEKEIHGADSPKSFPSFSDSRHNILCSELKQLYVAITRTRQRLWICENNAEFFQPMLDYWGRSDLVQVRDIDDSLAETMQRASRPEEWKSRGIKLFWEKNYEMAALCFEKAGEEAWEKRVKASRLRAAADCLRDSSSKEANIKLREAAEIFDSINCVESAVKCFCDLGTMIEQDGFILKSVGNLFRECLASCVNGNYFDKGLQYIENWKKQASWNSIIMARIPEINKIAQEFLENNALKCYRSKDNASLLKIVRAFPSMESKRKFLKSLDCHGELLVLEEESGNFNMAAEIARRLGYILREIDLLEKAEKFADACMLILYYVLSNSLWVSGNQGWPLKSFPKKAELLNRAMSISKKDPGTFPASICAEAEILLPKQSNLSEIIQCYRASKKYESLSGEILSVRKLLDGHFQVKQVKYELDSELHLDPESFDGIISRNQVSVGTLVFVWNLWKEHSLTILDCLDRIAKLDFIKSEGTVQFYFNYYGVRKLQDNAAFHLLNPDAAWARNVVKNFTRNKVVTVEAYNFAPAAREFWHQELISVGFRVLDVLQPKYSLFVKIAERLPMSKLTYRQIGCAVMILLGYGKPKYSLFVKIAERLPMDSSWKSFIENLRRTMESDSVQVSDLSNFVSKGAVSESETLPSATFVAGVPLESAGCSPETLSHELHEALQETYNANWRTYGYISPNCFFYLVQRLLDLVPHSQGFFFTSKSSFLEYLMCLPSDGNPIASLFNYKNSYSAHIVEFAVRVVEHSLLNIEETAEWISISNLDSIYYLPVMMLKIIVILCLLCLNWDVPLDRLYEKLTVPHIRAQLPSEFHGALQRSHKNGTSFLAAVVEALDIIGDPLVIVDSIENDLKFACPNAIFLDLRSFSCKNEIMKVSWTW
ncbi:hypothetical protein C2S52_015126 [Perilla frutescens var. hirtella]|nr:hypothetical protein C2S52_015126 [Perilla frutescens var. hirtella]